MRRSIDRQRPRGRLMRRLGPLVAVLMVALLSPLATELVESLAHLSAAGHSADAVQDEHHRQQDSEQGCAGGVLHLCGCCPSTGFLTSVGVSLAAVQPSEILVLHRSPPSHAEGPLGGVFRPPIA